jgi:hypothetical protein
LPDDKREVVVELARDDLIRRLNDSVGNALFEAEVEVGLGSALLEEAEGSDDGKRHALALATNLEVLEGSLGLSTPVAISGDLERSERVGLLSELLRRGK